MRNVSIRNPTFSFKKYGRSRPVHVDALHPEALEVRHCSMAAGIRGLVRRIERSREFLWIRLLGGVVLTAWVILLLRALGARQGFPFGSRPTSSSGVATDVPGLPPFMSDGAAPPNLSTFEGVTKLPYLRLSRAVLTGDQVLAPASVSPNSTATSHFLTVMSSYYSASQNVKLLDEAQFYGAHADGTSPLRLCRRFEARTAVLTRPSHFGLRNLAHTTVDYLYPLVATLLMLEKVNLVRHIEQDPTLYPLPFVVVFDLRDIGQSGFPPNGGRERLLRVIRMIHSLVEDVYFIGRDVGLPYPVSDAEGWCFRDLSVGAREQPIRNWDWTYNPNSKGLNGISASERAAANALRPWLLEAFRLATFKFFEKECSKEHVERAKQRPARPAVVLGRSSQRRRLLNSDQLAERLDADYIPDFGELSWCDQYVAVHQRRSLIAMHGAEWSHLFSLGKPRHVVNIELFPALARKPDMYAALAIMLGVSRHAMAQVLHLNGTSFDPAYPGHEACIRMMERHRPMTAECLFQANLVLHESEMDQLRTWLDNHIQRD
jgi:hypothetical protein